MKVQKSLGKQVYGHYQDQRYDEIEREYEQQFETQHPEEDNS